MKGAALVMVVAALSGACGGSSEPGPVTFAADPGAEGATVFFRGRPEGARVIVDVVARGAADLHGTALRVTWNATELSHVETKPGLAWSKTAVFYAKEGTPGQLAIAWSEKGTTSGIDATGEAILGTIVFNVNGRNGSPIAFKADRSALVDSRGKTLPVTFRNGSVPARCRKPPSRMHAEAPRSVPLIVLSRGTGRENGDAGLSPPRRRRRRGACERSAPNSYLPRRRCRKRRGDPRAQQHV